MLGQPGTEVAVRGLKRITNNSPAMTGEMENGKSINVIKRFLPANSISQSTRRGQPKSGPSHGNRRGKASEVDGVKCVGETRLPK